MPDKKRMKLYESFKPWLKINPETEEFYLSENAPEEAKKNFKLFYDTVPEKAGSSLLLYERKAA